MMRIAIVIVAAAGSWATVLGAQDARLASQLDSSTARAVAKTIEVARGRGLPSEPLVAKALEGAVKHAPGARIEIAVSQLADRLSQSRDALAGNASAAEIVAGADALAVGVPRDALRRIRSERRDGSLAVPLGVLTQLISRGIGVPRASSMVLDLMHRGAGAAHFLSLNASVQQDIAAGYKPDAALDLRLKGILANLQGNSIRDDAEALKFRWFFRSRTQSVAAGLVCAFLAVPGMARAQWSGRSSVDLGVVRQRQDLIVDTDFQIPIVENAWNIAALWNRSNQRVSLTASGAASISRSGRSTRLGLGSVSLWGSPRRALRWELGATGTALGTSDTKPATSWVAFGREHLIGNGRGLWLGGGRGELNAETVGRAVNLAEAGLWAGRDHRFLSASVLTTWTSTTAESFPAFDAEQLAPRHVPIAFGDATLAGRWVAGPVDFDAGFGYRFGLRGAVTPKPSGTLGIAWWWTPNVALVTALGRQLTDAVRGTAQTRFATVAVRFSAEPRGRPRPAPLAESGGSAGAGAPRLDMVHDEDGTRRLRVRVLGATRVEIMGNFTDWQPIALEPREGYWDVVVRANAGSHHVLVRVNGGAWLPPANLPGMDDGFGGRVGLLVVP